MKYRIATWSVLFLLVCVPVHATVTFSNLMFDGLAYIQGNAVDAHPVMRIAITPNSGVVSYNSLVVTVDAARVADTYLWASPNLTVQLPSLAVGVHTLYLRAKDNDAIQTYSVTFNVKSASQQVLTPVYSYPSPATSNINFTYELAQTDTIKVSVFNMAGVRVYAHEYYRGTFGAIAGQNTISWNLVSGFGDVVSNGAYIIMLTGGNNSKIIAKGKFFIYK